MQFSVLFRTLVFSVYSLKTFLKSRGGGSGKIKKIIEKLTFSPKWGNYLVFYFHKRVENLPFCGQGRKNQFGMREVRRRVVTNSNCTNLLFRDICGISITDHWVSTAVYHKHDKNKLLPAFKICNVGLKCGALTNFTQCMSGETSK